MKRAIGRFVLSQEFQLSMAGALLRGLVRRTRSLYPYSIRFLQDTQALERPHYAYCVLVAADLARRLGKERISVIEFGVAGGNGIAFLADLAGHVLKETGVQVDCYGFDTGRGMPKPAEARDLPYWFKESQYAMDVERLRSRVPEAKLVLGELAETVPRFLDESNPAPIGAILNDVDYYSSTNDSLALLEQASRRPECFLPRISTYFDDIIGSEVEMYGPYNGQLAAIADFNAAHEDKKIHLNQNLLPKVHLKYRHQIYYVHLMAHPEYEQYIGGADQVGLEQSLRLR